MAIRSLVIWGAGGHAKVVADVARSTGAEILCFVDDCAEDGAKLLGYDVARPHSLRARVPEVAFLVAIGNNQARARCFDVGSGMGWKPSTIIHPSASVSEYAEIAAGCVVMPRVVVNAASTIGQNCILNTAAIIEHDCIIRNHVHISPSATLAGKVAVEDFAHIGMSSSVLQGTRIGRSATVGAGAVVTRNVKDNNTVVGVPARVMVKG